MALHDTLRQLLAARGAAVTRDAAEWRGALDDYLGESEASVGEVNLLVDAVRLGALDRLLGLLDAGAVPSAAVDEAGAALARDRGSDDQRRAAWAVAALGFALDRVEEEVVERYASPSLGGTPAPEAPEAPGTPTQPAEPTPPPPPPPPGPAPDPSPEPEPEPGRSGTDLRTAAGAEAVPTSLGSSGRAPTPPPPVGARDRRRRTPLLLVLSFALLLGIAGGTGLAIWMQRDTGASGGDPEDPPSSDVADGGDAVPDDGIVVNYTEETGDPDAPRTSVIYRVNDAKGNWRPLTPGPNDIFPAISLDRTHLAYLAVEDAGWVPMILPIGGVAQRAFPAGSPCAHGGRAGWRPAGPESGESTEYALVCMGDDDVAEGMYLADVEGGEPTPLIDDPQANGSPTWTSPDHFVYIREDAAGARTLWSWSLGDDQPRPLLPETADGEEVVGEISHPDWSEERQRLLFLVHPDGDDGFGQIWTAEVDRDSHALVDAVPLGPEPFNHPVWSPDGSEIAATVAQGEDERLVIVDPDDPSNLNPVDEVPPGAVGIPVWGTR